MVVEIAIHQLAGVVDNAHRGDGKQPQVGPDQQGLGIRIADAADTGATLEILQILLKLGAEGAVFNVVNLPLEPVFPVVDGHAAPAGAQVGVVVGAKEHIQHHIPFCDGAKKSAHA